MTSFAPDARADALRAWLATLAADHPVDPDTLEPASADASFRRYFRVRGAASDSATLIAMDAPPPEKCREYAQIAQLMADAGLHVPVVYAADYERGFMLLSDLGRRAYIDVLDPADADAARPLLRAALDALIRWQSASRPGVLPAFDDALIRAELELLPDWYMTRHLGMPPSADDRATLDALFATLARAVRAQPQVYMHRDYMPRNLMLVEPSAANPGILDFQDAVEGPLAYDVVSLLRDAFISWDEAFEIDCCAYYWEHARRAGLPVRDDFAEFYRDVEWTGLQRHLKVLGIFARLNYRDGKPRYLSDLPRFVGYARRVAGRYRELAPLARLLDRFGGRTAAAAVGYTF